MKNMGQRKAMPDTYRLIAGVIMAVGICGVFLFTGLDLENLIDPDE